MRELDGQRRQHNSTCDVQVEAEVAVEAENGDGFLVHKLQGDKIGWSQGEGAWRDAKEDSANDDEPPRAEG
jgi:hypothetical protein